jgi:hypothetical protein
MRASWISQWALNPMASVLIDNAWRGEQVEEERLHKDEAEITEM